MVKSAASKFALRIGRQRSIYLDPPHQLTLSKLLPANQAAALGLGQSTSSWSLATLTGFLDSSTGSSTLAFSVLTTSALAGLAADLDLSDRDSLCALGSMAIMRNFFTSPSLT